MVIRLSKKRIFLGSVLLFLILVYNIVFSSFFANHVIKNILKHVFPDAKIDFHARSFGLFTGLEIENLSIYDRVSQTPVVLVSGVRLRYFLPGILVGDAGIRELSLENLEIHIYRKDERWNFESLTGKPVPEEDKKKERPLPETIRLYLPLKVYAYLSINDLKFFYRLEETEKEITRIKEEFVLQDLTLRFGVLTKRFSEIPLNIKALDIIDDFVVHINPRRHFSLRYFRNPSVAGKPELTLKLYKKEEPYHFHLELVAGADSLEVHSRGRNVKLHTEVIFSMDYRPEDNAYELRQFSLRENENYLLFLEGRFQPQGDDYYVELQHRQLSPGSFSLEPYARLLSLLLEKPVRFGGEIQFSRLSLQGFLKHLEGKLKILSRYLYYEDYAIHNFFVDAEGIFDVSPFLGFLYKKETLEKYRGVEFIKSFLLHGLSFHHRGATLQAHGEIGKDVNLHLKIRNFFLEEYTKPHLQGIAFLDASARSDKQLSAISLDLLLQGKQLRYLFDGFYSPVQDMKLQVTGNFHLQDTVSIIDVDVKQLALLSQLQQNFLFLKGTSQIRLGTHQNYRISIEKLHVDYRTLEKQVPVSLRNQIQAFKGILEEGVLLYGDTFIEIAEKNQYRTRLYLSLPSLTPSKITWKANLIQTPQEIQFQEFLVSGWNEDLHIHLKGKLVNNKNNWVPYLQILLQYQNYKVSEVYKNLFLRGNFLLELSLGNREVNGNLFIRNFDVKYVLPCDNPDTSLCRYYEIQNLNLALPFRHHLDQKFHVTYQDRDLLSQPQPNFLIRSIRSNYSIDNSYFQDGIYYLGSKSENAVEGYIHYDKNILWIPYLRLHSYLHGSKNGSLELKNFYLDLADLQPENMSAAGSFYIINFDLNAFFPRAENVFKGILSGYAMFRSKNFGEPLENMEAVVSIYQIGRDFGGFLVRIIAPTIVASAVNNTLRINSLNLELKNGLVYSTIRVSSPGFVSLSRIIRPSEEEIRQERIPVAEFLKRSEKEIQRELE